MQSGSYGCTFILMKNLRINISGKVRKTGFLFFVKQFSQLYSINGYAKYTGETSVFIEAEGKHDALDMFVKYCRIGPVGSKIKSIRIEEGKVKNYKSFAIIDTLIPGKQSGRLEKQID